MGELPSGDVKIAIEAMAMAPVEIVDLPFYPFFQWWIHSHSFWDSEIQCLFLGMTTDPLEAPTSNEALWTGGFEYCAFEVETASTLKGEMPFHHVS